MYRCICIKCTSLIKDTQYKVGWEWKKHHEKHHKSGPSELCSTFHIFSSHKKETDSETEENSQQCAKFKNALVITNSIRRNKQIKMNKL